MINGIKITTSSLMCEERPIRPKRPHRRSRIQKKWGKRYGWVMGGCTGHGYEMAGRGIVGCKHFVAKLKSLIKSEG